MTAGNLCCYFLRLRPHHPLGAHRRHRHRPPPRHARPKRRRRQEVEAASSPAAPALWTYTLLGMRSCCGLSCEGSSSSSLGSTCGGGVERKPVIQRGRLGVWGAEGPLRDVEGAAAGDDVGDEGGGNTSEVALSASGMLWRVRRGEGGGSAAARARRENEVVEGGRGREEGRGKLTRSYVIVLERESWRMVLCPLLLREGRWGLCKHALAGGGGCGDKGTGGRRGRALLSAPRANAEN